MSGGFRAARRAAGLPPPDVERRALEWKNYNAAQEAKLNAIDFYDRGEWQRLRYRVLQTMGGCCQCCGERGSTRNPLQVDHIKPRSKYPELELAETNLQVLCRLCNMGKGAWDETDWRSR